MYKKGALEMKKSRYTEEHVIGSVRRMEAGRKAKELAQISAQASPRYTHGSPSRPDGSE
jgi:hypothetical protein